MASDTPCEKTPHAWVTVTKGANKTYADEELRALDTLQTTMQRGIATPGDWTVMQSVTSLASASDEDVKAKYGDYEAVLTCLGKAKKKQRSYISE
ncbi:hypothetical protein [Vreelandella massiliensis]|uniref:hypothetical protein n=1 Tax=Vreelandella massiliensis TaxID=1816686 RepID=UPI00096A8B74|nr:hypothetical protein [Halomonas massiliensis]